MLKHPNALKETLHNTEINWNTGGQWSEMGYDNPQQR